MQRRAPARGHLIVLVLLMLCSTLAACSVSSRSASSPSAPATPSPLVEPQSATPSDHRGSSPDPHLWFSRSRTTSPRLLFAHYFGPEPRSVDNRDPDFYTRNYLTTDGEDGAHAAYGGFWRDRPLERPPLPGDFRLQDAVWEIQSAQAVGIDGFLVDLLSIDSASYRTYQKLTDAAVQLATGFKIVPMIDATGSAASRGTPDEWARAISYFVGKPSSYYLPDGRYLVASFYADRKSPVWWSERLRAVAAHNRVTTAFHAGLLQLSRIGEYASIAAYAGPWSYGADPVRIHTTDSSAAARARSAGLKWLGSALTQNIRPAQGTYDEAFNSEAMRVSWSRVELERADLVQVVTWNDFSEGSQLVPSVARSWGPAAITAYHAEKWKTGAAPVVLRDVLILSHRDQPLTGATFRSGQSRLMTQKSGSGPRAQPRNAVEALTYLKRPADVTVSVAGVTHTYRAPAGEYARLFPLNLGTVAGSISRDGVEVASVSSPFTVTATPVSQDRQYFFVSSLEGTNGQHPLMRTGEG